MERPGGRRRRRRHQLPTSGVHTLFSYVNKSPSLPWLLGIYLTTVFLWSLSSTFLFSYGASNLPVASVPSNPQAPQKKPGGVSLQGQEGAKIVDEPLHRTTAGTVNERGNRKVQPNKVDNRQRGDNEAKVPIPVERRVALAKEFSLFDRSNGYHESLSFSEDEVEASVGSNPSVSVGLTSKKNQMAAGKIKVRPIDRRTKIDPPPSSQSKRKDDPEAEYSTSFEDGYPHFLDVQTAPSAGGAQGTSGKSPASAQPKKDASTRGGGGGSASKDDKKQENRHHHHRHQHPALQNPRQARKPSVKHGKPRPLTSSPSLQKGEKGKGGSHYRPQDKKQQGLPQSAHTTAPPNDESNNTTSPNPNTTDAGASPSRRLGGSGQQWNQPPPQKGRPVNSPGRPAKPFPPAAVIAEARFRQPSEKLKSLITPQDAGEWASEKEEFETHYPFHQPIEIRSVRTNERSVIVFEEVLGAGGQGVVFQARDVATKHGMALKVFRIRPDHRMDDRKDKDVLRRRVQSELAIWNHIPAGIEPRQWSNVAHLVIPLDVVEPIHPSPTPPKDQTRYAVQWVQMDLFAGDLARMTKIFTADASVKLEVTEQLFLATMRLHDLGLVHSDVKLANYFIGMDGRIFLGDHSLAHPRAANIACMLGTLRYLPPENMRCLSEGHRRIMTTERKDVWALGVVVHRLWCGQQHPYEMAELWSKDLFVRASRATIEELDLSSCDGDAILPVLSLLRLMLMPDAAYRPTLREIHRFHPIFLQRKRVLLKKRNLLSLLGEIEHYRNSQTTGAASASESTAHHTAGAPTAAAPN